MTNPHNSRIAIKLQNSTTTLFLEELKEWFPFRTLWALKMNSNLSRRITNQTQMLFQNVSHFFLKEIWSTRQRSTFLHMFVFSDNDRWDILKSSFTKNAKCVSLSWIKDIKYRQYPTKSSNIQSMTKKIKMCTIKYSTLWQKKLAACSYTLCHFYMCHKL